MSSFADKELTILFNILKDSSITQRELAKATGTSLGLINLIIQKFAGSGYLMISHPNKRKLEYTLTPLGLSETFKRAQQKATDTIRNYRTIRLKLAELFKVLHNRGYEYFSIHGDSELEELLIDTFHGSLGDFPVTLGQEHKSDPKAIVLAVTTDPLPDGFQGDVFNVLKAIEA